MDLSFYGTRFIFENAGDIFEAVYDEINQELPQMWPRIQSLHVKYLMESLIVCISTWILIGLTRYFGADVKFAYSRSFQKFNESILWVIFNWHAIHTIFVIFCQVTNYRPLDLQMMAASKGSLIITRFLVQLILQVMAASSSMLRVKGQPNIQIKKLRYGWEALTPYERKNYDSIWQQQLDKNQLSRYTEDWQNEIIYCLIHLLILYATIKIIMCMHSYFIGTRLHREHKNLPEAHIDFWDQLLKLMDIRLMTKYLGGPSTINRQLRNRFNMIRSQHERHRLQREIVERNRLRAQAADNMNVDDDTQASLERIRQRQMEVQESHASQESLRYMEAALAAH